MYLVTNNGVVMFDTPWDTQFQPLPTAPKLGINKERDPCVLPRIGTLIKTAGLEYYSRQIRIKTYIPDGRQNKKNKRRILIIETHSRLDNIPLKPINPGQGHTETYYLSGEKSYGGCLIFGRR